MVLRIKMNNNNNNNELREFLDSSNIDYLTNQYEVEVYGYNK